MTTTPGLAVVYVFEVEVGQEDRFVEAWARLTELIAEHRGGWGSRLHRDQQGRFVAYAAWPDRDVFDADTALPAEADEPIATMREVVVRREEPWLLVPERDLLA